ncbi:protein TEX261-like isoform X2 [Pollicipes pollicipes]|uniref:protein TEX261-like isoform X2 n=1 Tax=Pollicipes pollicipes TaxID=41117 RepID=UPI001884C392|nr:protein TEX261-like isoform X2 [Pollicipes pollicipes]
MWFLNCVSWVSFILQICFFTLATASCLYYMAELVEEFSVAAGRFIRCTIAAVLLVHLGVMVFESVPLHVPACGVLGLATMLLMMRTFPYFELASPSFALACVMLVVNHYLAFQHFTSVYYPFHEVIGYFVVCLWLVPLELLVSLSANENVLPTVADHSSSNRHDDVLSNYFSRKGKKYGLLSLFNYAKDGLLPVRNKKSY